VSPLARHGRVSSAEKVNRRMPSSSAPGQVASGGANELRADRAGSRRLPGRDSKPICTSPFREPLADRRRGVGGPGVTRPDHHGAGRRRTVAVRQSYDTPRRCSLPEYAAHEQQIRRNGPTYASVTKRARVTMSILPRPASRPRLSVSIVLAGLSSTKAAVTARWPRWSASRRGYRPRRRKYSRPCPVAAWMAREPRIRCCAMKNRWETTYSGFRRGAETAPSRADSRQCGSSVLAIRTAAPTIRGFQA